MPPERHLLTLWLGRHPDGKERDHEGGEVCEHVSSISGDGQGVAEHPANDLYRHEEQTQDRGNDQLPSSSAEFTR